jgi:hypothetical protein
MWWFGMVVVWIGLGSCAACESGSDGHASGGVAGAEERWPVIDIELDWDVARPAEYGTAAAADTPQRKLSFRQPNSNEVEACVLRGLAWLVEHQWDDGGWSFDHTLSTRCANRCPNPGRAVRARTAASSLALLALLGAGQTHRQGVHADAVRRGLRFLLEQNHDERCSDENELGRALSDAWTATVYCSLITMTGDETLIPSARQSLERLVRLQDRTTGGWPIAPGGAADPTTTAWVIGALESAKLARRLKFPAEPLNAAEAYLDALQRNSGLGFIPADGDDPSGDPTRNYFSAQAVRQSTISRVELGDWNRKLRRRLVDTQATEGHVRGSWSPTHHAVTGSGGRLYETALNLLSLEVYYRHLPIWRDRPPAEAEP